MAEKKFCDFCGVEITGRSFDVTTHDNDADKDRTRRDCCVKCITRLERELRFVVKDSAK